MNSTCMAGAMNISNRSASFALAGLGGRRGSQEQRVSSADEVSIVMPVVRHEPDAKEPGSPRRSREYHRHSTR